MVATIIVLSLLLISSIYVNINLTKKFEKLEEMAESSVDALLENEKLLTSLKNRLLSQQSYLKNLDRIGAFEADDETGYFFKELKSTVNDISAYFGENLEDDEKKSVLDKRKIPQMEFEKDYYL